MTEYASRSAAEEPNEPTREELTQALQKVIDDSEIWRPRILMSAVELGVFDALDREPTDSNALAQKLGVRSEGLLRLLRALHEMGYVERAGQTYANSMASKYFLNTSSQLYMGSWFRLNALDWPAWSELTDVIRTGKPATAGSIFADSERLCVLLYAAHERARLFHIQEVVATLDLTGVGTLLDLGGGAGTYSMALCEAHDSLNAIIFDLPAAIAVARNIVATSPAVARISFAQGDFNADPLGGPYDVVFVSNVLHGEAPEAAQTLIQKTFGALEPGGQLIIRDSFLENDGTNALSGAVFSLTLMVETVSGRTHRRSEIRDMLDKAGFVRIEEPGDKLIIGFKSE